MTDKHKVLIVEDEPAVALALNDSLKNEGYEVLSEKDGEGGLATALKEQPDLIIADLKMPGMGGLAMIEKIREDSWGANAKIIILSNLTDLGSLQSAMEKGTFHYMVKGDSSMADIVAAVKKQLGE